MRSARDGPGFGPVQAPASCVLPLHAGSARGHGRRHGCVGKWENTIEEQSSISSFPPLAAGALTRLEAS